MKALILPKKPELSGKTVTISIEAMSKLLSHPVAHMMRKIRIYEEMGSGCFPDRESLPDVLKTALNGIVIESLYSEIPYEKIKKRDIQWAEDYLNLLFRDECLSDDDAAYTQGGEAESMKNKQ